MQSKPVQAAKAITEYASDFTPKVVITLGSGLSGVANQVKDPIIIPYQKIPGFPACTVAGHQGQVVLGTVNNVPVAFLQGRAHLYEGADPEITKTMVRAFKLMGSEIWVSTNAAASLRESVAPGELMIITDHINFQGTNPLLGENQDEFGSRFFAMDNGYNSFLQKKFIESAELEGITLHHGVYLSVLGPNYETPAEIRAFRTLGADAVGMSTVAEVLVANHCGLKVGGISTITNYAAGIAKTPITHEEVLHHGALVADKLAKLLFKFVTSV